MRLDVVGIRIALVDQVRIHQRDEDLVLVLQEAIGQRDVDEVQKVEDLDPGQTGVKIPADNQLQLQLKILHNGLA